MTNGEILLQVIGELDEELIPEISFDNDKHGLGNVKRWLTITEICAACAVLVVMIGGLIIFRTNGTESGGSNKGAGTGNTGQANGGGNSMSQSTGQEITWERYVEKQELDQDLPTTTSEAQSCDALNYSSYYEEEEYEEMKKVIFDSEMLSGMGEETAEITEAYKLYSVQNVDPVKELRAGNHLTEYVSEGYRWVVILDSKLTLWIAKKQSGWEVLGYGRPSDKQEPMDVEQLKSLNDNLESLERNGVSIQTVQCVDVPVYHMRLVCVQGKNEDYYIPYGSREDLTNLTNGKAYTAREIADILEQVFH